MVGNAYLPFYRVNSVFWDPSIYGRFLMIAIVAALVVVVLGGSQRAALGAAAATHGLLDRPAALVLAVELRRADRGCRRPARARLAAGRAPRGGLRRARARLDRHREPEHPERFPEALRAPRSTGRPATAPGLVYNGVRVAVRHPVVGVGVGGFRRHFARAHRPQGKGAEEGGLARHAGDDRRRERPRRARPVRLGAGRRVRACPRPHAAATRSPGGVVLAAGARAPRRRRCTRSSTTTSSRTPTTWGLLGIAGLAYATTRPSPSHSGVELSQAAAVPWTRSETRLARLGRLRSRQPDEHLEPGPAPGIRAPGRLVEPDRHEHVVAVELPARRRPHAEAARPSRRGRRGRSAPAARGRRPRTARGRRARARPGSPRGRTGRRRSRAARAGCSRGRRSGRPRRSRGACRGRRARRTGRSSPAAARPPGRRSTAPRPGRA